MIFTCSQEAPFTAIALKQILYNPFGTQVQLALNDISFKKIFDFFKSIEICFNRRKIFYK